ncbi:hypothetical protein KFK09_024560 [Dendrobium nobile]|uniref:Uncharacterized protein n=1 Tax=Dendrobium nobile TaxID=94219 RepID=A0A8T3ACY6_DENNO|nr:hypothetical protein KFK09_024560 [Dendrobium nobile]
MKHFQEIYREHAETQSFSSIVLPFSNSYILSDSSILRSYPRQEPVNLWPKREVPLTSNYQIYCLPHQESMNALIRFYIFLTASLKSDKSTPETPSTYPSTTLISRHSNLAILRRV